MLLIQAQSLPRSTPAEEVARDQAVQAGVKRAAEVPLLIMRLAGSHDLWAALSELASIVNLKSRSDLEVGVRMLQVGVWGSWRNVLINAVDMKDTEWVKAVTTEAESIMQAVDTQVPIILGTLAQRATQEVAMAKEEGGGGKGKKRGAGGAKSAASAASGVAPEGSGASESAAVSSLAQGPGHTHPVVPGTA